MLRNITFSCMRHSVAPWLAVLPSRRKTAPGGSLRVSRYSVKYMAFKVSNSGPSLVVGEALRAERTGVYA